MNTWNQNKITYYANEFYPIKITDNEVLAYDVENMRIVKLNNLELSVLEHVKNKPGDLADLRRTFRGENGKEIADTVNELVAAELLSSAVREKTSELEISQFENKRLDHFKKKNLMQIALNVTHACNLKCDYCYGDGGPYGGPSENMTRETAKQAVDFLLKMNGDDKNFRITFFGGEPLINFELVKEVVTYARKEAAARNKTLHMGMTTNGVLLSDEISDFLIKENIEVTISMDGPKEIHNKGRKLKSRKPKNSFDVIFPNVVRHLEKAKSTGHRCSFRATLTRPGLIDIYEVIDFFRQFDVITTHYDFAEYDDNGSPNNLKITGQDLVLFREKLKEVAATVGPEDLKSEKFLSLLLGPLKV